jgi:hypothetical protein
MVTRAAYSYQCGTNIYPRKILNTSAQDSREVALIKAEALSESDISYAGFWYRMTASLIDSILMSVLIFFAGALIGVLGVFSL